ncbi:MULTISPECIES: twin-arginine translocase TatA/TatE family subunit [Microcoleaceae]|uniref:twin-arginine translocase TatA/TatE family subunit n=1 Tax=Microcoleaceae TaxID=1892252 RepID=UPI002FD5C58B
MQDAGKKVDTFKDTSRLTCDRASFRGDDCMFGLGLPEMGIIAVVAILIFGPKKIPELGNALGKTLRSFKEGVGLGDDESALDEKEKEKKKEEEAGPKV